MCSINHETSSNWKWNDKFLSRACSSEHRFNITSPSFVIGHHRAITPLQNKQTLKTARICHSLLSAHISQRACHAGRMLQPVGIRIYCFIYISFRFVFVEVFSVALFSLSIKTLLPALSVDKHSFRRALSESFRHSFSGRMLQLSPTPRRAVEGRFCLRRSNAT